MGRGRGRTGGGLIGGIGAADRTGGGLPGGAFRSLSSGGGVGGRMRWGSSKAGRRYSSDQLAKLYKQMLYAGRWAGLAGPGRGARQLELLHACMCLGLCVSMLAGGPAVVGRHPPHQRVFPATPRALQAQAARGC